jgi:CubicO group peptidase (beta-lactamase class C family)
VDDRQDRSRGLSVRTIRDLSERLIRAPDQRLSQSWRALPIVFRADLMTTSVKRRQVLAGSLAFPFLASSAGTRLQAAPANGGFESLLRPTVHTGRERWPLAQRMSHHHVPGVAVARLRNGRIERIRGYGSRIAGRDLPIGPDTLFSVGSVSKVATAALCLRLVADGRLDLDRDVSRWLRRWRVPAGPAGDNAGITLRMLLSHTAGFNLHGFRDFEPQSSLPTLTQTLNGTPPAQHPALARIAPAGMRTRYSGGGYMLVQAVIEDAIGEPFDTVAQRHLFGPLGTTRSHFSATPAQNTPDIAHAHDEAGRPTALPRGWQSFPELAPSGLWTSAADLARLVLALGASYRGAPGAILPKTLAVDMMTAVSPGLFGLGPRLAGEGDAEIFHHAGANDSYKAYIEGNLASGDGLVILTNGANGDVLGDEIRNAVSDAMHWPGDWSVVTRAGADPAWLDACAGAYRRREGQDLEIAGMLDTTFEVDDLAIARAGDGLMLQMRGRNRQLAPLSSNRFVVPDAYVPAGTLQLSFKRDARGRVGALTIMGGGTLLFDRWPPGAG